MIGNLLNRRRRRETAVMTAEGQRGQDQGGAMRMDDGDAEVMISDGVVAPRHPWAGWGRSGDRQEDIEKMLPHVEDCLAAYPERLDFAEQLARHQYALGLHEEAAVTLESCLRSFRTDEAPTLLMANIEMARGRVDVAVLYFEAALVLQPGSPAALAGLAEASEKRHRWDEARDAAGRLLELDPNNSVARVVLGRCLLRSGQPEACLEVLRTPQGVLNSRSQGLHAMALGRLGRWDEADGVLREWLARFPEDFFVLRVVSWVCGRRGSVEAGQRALHLSRRYRADVRQNQADRKARLRAEAAERMMVRRATGSVLEVGPVQQLTVVSGLPGAGAGLMMEILAAGGLPILAAERRQLPHQHPDWHWEWDAMHSMCSDPRVLDSVGGRVIMIPSGLVPQLDPKHEYRIVWMKRPVEEVIDEQFPMAVGGLEMPAAERAQLVGSLGRHVEQMGRVLRDRPQVELLEVDHSMLLREPEVQLGRLRAFFGDELTGSLEQMKEVLERARLAAGGV
jgi:tetratricopeptide (TPR) repeat protein